MTSLPPQLGDSPARPARRRSGCARRGALAACCALAALLASASRPARAADEEKLERFLARLELVDLQIVHLERSLESQTLGPQERDRLARRLADLYAEQLMNNAGDEAKYQDLVQRIQSLLKRFPQAHTTALQVMLLQADYNRAEGQIAQWIADRSNQKALEDARSILQTIAPQLDGHQQQLHAQVNALYAELEKLPQADPDLAARESEVRRLQAVLGRASYFAGWANYYLGLTRPAGGEAQYRRAAEIFRKLLGVEGGDYARLDPEYLSLEIIWRARAVIGLGLSEAALGNVDGSRALFQLLEHPSTPAEVQDQASYWYVQGLINAGRLEEARQYAEKQIATFTAEATQGKVSLCVALVRAGFGEAGSAAAAGGRELGMLGITGLARLGQYNAVQQLLEKYDVSLGEQNGFFLQWMQGRRLFAQAQESKKKEDYLAAAKALEAALEQPDAKAQTAAAGHCRYELGWCYYRAGELETAARRFEQAISPLKAAGAEEAAQAAWMAFVAYKQLAEDQRRYVSSAIDMLETIKRDFPSHQYAKNADYYIARLQRTAGSPEESIRNLQKIPPSDSNYLTARYDLCVLLYQQWSQAASARAKGAAVDALRQAAEEYVRAAGLRGDQERRLRVLLMVAAAALGSEPVDAGLAEDFLSRAAPLAEAAPAQSSAKAEYHYRRMQLARDRNDDATRLTHAQWLAEHAPGSTYELAALIEVARDLERRMDAASQADRAKLHEEAYEVYTRLVERLGASTPTAASQKNARVALSRLAESAYATGRYEEAARRLETLLAVDPKNEDYLRRAGLARFQARQYDAALTHWRTLSLGLPRGSEEWFEAKYYQIASLAQTDLSQAKQALQQLQLLYPEYGGAAWRGKFESLAQSLK